MYIVNPRKLTVLQPERHCFFEVVESRLQPLSTKYECFNVCKQQCTLYFKEGKKTFLFVSTPKTTTNTKQSLRLSLSYLFPFLGTLSVPELEKSILRAPRNTDYDIVRSTFSCCNSLCLSRETKFHCLSFLRRFV